MIYISDTPYYLVTIGKETEARKEAALIYKENYVGTFMDDLIQRYNQDFKSMSERGFWTSVKNPDKLKMALFGMYLFTAQQLAGINIVNFYSNKIFEETFDTNTASLMTFLMGVFDLLASFFGLWIFGILRLRTLYLFGNILLVF